MAIRILIVDDDTFSRNVLETLLRKGLSVPIDFSSEVDRVSALTAHQLQPFDAVIADVRMPQLEGAHILKAIRSSPSGATTTLVAMSSHDWGQSTAAMSYNIQAWWDWYNNEYVPFKNEQALKAALSQP